MELIWSFAFGVKWDNLKLKELWYLLSRLEGGTDNTSLLPHPFFPCCYHRQYTGIIPLVGGNIEVGTVEAGPGPEALHNPSLSTWKVSLPEEFLPNNFQVTLLQQKHATFERGYFDRFDCIGKVLVSHIWEHKHLVCLFVFPLVFTVCSGHLQHLERISVWFVACKRV